MAPYEDEKSINKDISAAEKTSSVMYIVNGIKMYRKCSREACREQAAHGKKRCYYHIKVDRGLIRP
jgi:hypothetical protein